MNVHADPFSPPDTALASADALGRGGRTLQGASLRLLQRTAQLLATTPGGLRFRPGSRPWLEGLPPSNAARVSAHPRLDGGRA